MSDPTRRIGSVIRRVRTERELTLEEASQRAGVSSSMLGQIERGESNPTVSTLWKIAEGLRISFSELMGEREEGAEPEGLDSVEPVTESEGKMILYNLFPFNPVTGFEYFYIELLPGARHVSPPHRDSVEEFVVVTEGALVLQVGAVEHVMKAPSFIRFNPGVSHVYANPYGEKAVFQNIVKY